MSSKAIDPLHSNQLISHFATSTVIWRDNIVPLIILLIFFPERLACNYEMLSICKLSVHTKIDGLLGVDERVQIHAGTELSQDT